MSERKRYGVLEKPEGAVDMGDPRVCATLARETDGSPIVLLWHLNHEPTKDGKPNPDHPGHDWVAARPSLHTQTPTVIEDAEQLAGMTLDPSIGWTECCGMHGWIKNGLWTDA